MKKALLTVLVLLVLGLPAVSYWFGLRAEDAIEAQRQRLAVPAGTRLTLEEKHRGIFTSDYRYALTYTPTAFPTGLTQQPSISPVTVDLLVTVHHGPIPLTSGGFKPALALVDTTLVARAGTPQAVTLVLDALPDLRRTTLRTTFDFSGNGRTSLTVPPAKGPVRLADGTVLDVQWQGASGTCDIPADATSFDLSLTAPLLVVTDKTTTITWQGFELTGHSSLYGQNLYLGDTTLSLTALRLESAKPDVPPFALTNLGMTVSSGLRNDVVDMLWTVHAAAVDLKTQTKAGLEAAFSLKNLDAASLDATLGEIRRVSGPGGPGGPAGATPEAQVQEMAAIFLRQAGGIFSKNPRFALDRFDLTLPSGKIAASGFLAYSGAGPLPADPLAALGRFKASFAAKAAQPALLDILTVLGQGNPALGGPTARQQAEAVVADLIRQGFVAPVADGLSASADFDGAALVVNGKSLFRMPSQP